MVAGALHGIQVDFFHAPKLEMIEIGLKALVKAEARVQYGRANKRRRGITMVAQNFRECRSARRNSIAAEIVNAGRERNDPVMSDVCDGKVTGTGVKAWVKRAPVAASWSMCGV